MQALALENVMCQYGGQVVVRSVSFHLNQGDISCLLGPSGCGKTTLLRAIAGLHPITGGRILVNGRPVAGNKNNVPPERRRVGLVFQDYALFPHLNVTDNIHFGLHKLPPKRRQEISDRLLEVVDLAHLKARFPHELSGGQQQRLALARALAPKPDILLMDEPFSNLDIELRERVRGDVRRILKQEQVTTILVTHDQEEAFAFADRIGVMNDGKLLQWDTPYNLYHEPNSRFIADFVGQGVFVSGILLQPDTVETSLGRITGNRAYDWGEGARVDVLIRPDDIIPDEKSDLKASVVERAFKGAEILYTLRLENGSTVLSLFPSHTDYPIGAQVKIRIEADHLVAFLAAS